MTKNDIATVAMTVHSIATAAEVWCVFDNTASGAAIENAWELREQLSVDHRLVNDGPEAQHGFACCASILLVVL